MLLAFLACASGPATLAPDEVTPDTASSLPSDTAPTWTACAEPAPLRLNELVAANIHGATDEDGDTSDWFELQLVDGGAPTSLAGWAVSDDPATPWALPDQELGATPLVVWASGKDRTSPALHAAFSLDALGDELFLLGADGCVADHVTTPRMYEDVAYGRTADGSWAWFLAATPGAENTTESRPGFADPPKLSPAAGFVAAGTGISTAGEGTIRYSTDGRVPTASDAEFPAGLAVPTGGPFVVRARAFVDGLWPSRTTTATWLTDATLADSGVTVIALTAEPADLFDPETGIYELGPDYEPWYPYFGANFWEVWERDVHVEVFAPGGEPTVTQDGGIQIAGGYSRAFDQRNFDLIARTAYGPETFSAQIFPEETLDEFHTLYLRNGGDWCGTQLVDATVQALFRDDAGVRSEAVDAQAYTPALVYINGEFWGLYELKERLDEQWPADHRGADPDNLDFLKLGWTHEPNWTVESGDWVAFDAMNTLATTDLSDDGAWADFTAQVDTDNLAATTVVQGWIGNTDWWGNNLRLWRERTDDGRFRWMAYDFGHGWPDYSYDHLATTTSGSWPGLPIGAALENPAFRDRFVNIHGDYLNTSLRAEVASARLQRLAAEVRPVMKLQRDRWCGGAPMRDWESAIDYADTFTRERPRYIDAQLQDHLGLHGHAALRIDADPPEGGTFRLAVVSVTAPFEGTYYQGVPVTVTAVPSPGYTFAGWSGDASGAGVTITLPMVKDVEVGAAFLKE